MPFFTTFDIASGVSTRAPGVRNHHSSSAFPFSLETPRKLAGAGKKTVFVVGLKCVFVILLVVSYYVAIVVAFVFLQIELGLGHALVRAALASRGDEPPGGDDAENYQRRRDAPDS